MKSTPGYGFYQFAQRADAQEAAAMKTMSAQAKGASKGGNHGMKTVKRVAGVKVNSK